LTLRLVESSSPADVMSIGRFAHQNGLSIGALRHYAGIGLRYPARVDPATGYLYYTDDQLEWARRIATPRDLDVPLGLIRRAYRTAGRRDDAERHRVLGYAVVGKVAGAEERDLLRSDLTDITSRPSGPAIREHDR
jgi:DNA-binding transcriptional MerR regulator